jgi:selenocysteine-specific elongation factor
VKRVVVGTAGHIDHGKTRLLEALTGVDCDRWAEEKARGITIDLGFTHLAEPGVQVGFVDVPGHQKFLHNALAGLGGIRLMMLVVAADEGVELQTREHLDVCELL